MNRIQQLKAKWRKENYSVGKYFGYPECCINEFCELIPELMAESLPDENDTMKLEAGHIDGNFTGFIPCLKHAEQIMKGEVVLKDLIQDRKEVFEFPISLG